jgi:hypothetical protein
MTQSEEEQSARFDFDPVHLQEVNCTPAHTVQALAALSALEVLACKRDGH